MTFVSISLLATAIGLRLEGRGDRVSKVKVSRRSNCCGYSRYNLKSQLPPEVQLAWSVVLVLAAPTPPQGEVLAVSIHPNPNPKHRRRQHEHLDTSHPAGKSSLDKTIA